MEGAPSRDARADVFSDMAEPQFGIERATAGLVTALFLASALLLAGLLYFILRDMERRTTPENGGQSAGVERVVPTPDRDAASSRRVTIRS